MRENDIKISENLFNTFCIVTVLFIGLLIFVILYASQDNQECPSGFTCTKISETPKWIANGSYPSLCIIDKYSYKFTHVEVEFENGTEIPRCKE